MSQTMSFFYTLGFILTVKAKELWDLHMKSYYRMRMESNSFQQCADDSDDQDFPIQRLVSHLVATLKRPQYIQNKLCQYELCCFQTSTEVRIFFRNFNEWLHVRKQMSRHCSRTSPAWKLVKRTPIKMSTWLDNKIQRLFTIRPDASVDVLWTKTWIKERNV